MILLEWVDLMDVALGSIGMTFTGTKVCELGNQVMGRGLPPGPAKNYLLSKGVSEHVSLDLNGKDGALKCNLAQPIDQGKNHFDMVTNYGTSEHVSDQYFVFLNIHNFCRPGGVMVHAVPLVGTCPRHCQYRYDESFFKNLSSDLGYRMVLLELRKRVPYKEGHKKVTLVCSVMVKEKDVDFVHPQHLPRIFGWNGSPS